MRAVVKRHHLNPFEPRSTPIYGGDDDGLDNSTGWWSRATRTPRVPSVGYNSTHTVSTASLRPVRPQTRAASRGKRQWTRRLDSIGHDEKAILILYDPDPGERVASWAYLLSASESKIFFDFRE